MKIRAITYFCNPRFPIEQSVLKAAGEFLRGAKAAFQAAGYEVQTTRVATVAFPALLGEKRLGSLPSLARELDLLIQQIDIGYLSLGPASPLLPRSYEVIPEAIAASRNVFFGGMMTSKRRGIDLGAVRSCAQVIVRCAPIESNGFANLRFAALANVPAGSAFFPAAYHEGAEPAFAIATEAADLAVEAFPSTASIDEGRRALISMIERHGQALGRIAHELAPRRTSRSRVPRAARPKFLGIDFSLAPYPAEARSLGFAFEGLGVPRVGLHGSLAAAAILTEAIDRAHFRRTGFSGLLLPVLEDSTLAARAAQGSLTVKDLLLYSAVCGTGLDTVPLPGDATQEQLVAVLLDLCALALRLDKPLTARLMPVPNKKAGDPTGFSFDYFANSKVMALNAEGLQGPFASSAPFTLRPR